MNNFKIAVVNWCLLILLFVLPGFAQTLPDNGDKGVISGCVISEKGHHPCAKIALYHNKQLVSKMRADSDGKFQFRGLNPGWYRITAITQENDLFESGNILVKSLDEDMVVCDEFSSAHKKADKSYRDANPLTKDVDSICVLKAKREMHVFDKGELLKTYLISLGSAPVGAKHFEGDRKTPEGLYHINGKNPYSQFHKSLGVSYPDKKDIEIARRAGKRTGGDIKIHGLPNGPDTNESDYIYDDWTWGCISVTDKQIDELFQHVIVGIPVMIEP